VFEEAFFTLDDAAFENDERNRQKRECRNGTGGER
jgi:hypothetical protein